MDKFMMADFAFNNGFNQGKAEALESIEAFLKTLESQKTLKTAEEVFTTVLNKISDLKNLQKN